MAANTPLKLLPAVAVAGRARATQLEQTFSNYVAILIRNQAVAPQLVRALPDSLPLARVHVPCSWRKGVRPIARRAAKKFGLTINALVEALIALDVQSPDQALTILPREPKPKLNYELQHRSP